MTRFAAPIAEQIWDMKYRFKAADGTPHDVKTAGKKPFTKRWKISNICQQAASLLVPVPHGG